MNAVILLTSLVGGLFVIGVLLERGWPRHQRFTLAIWFGIWTVLCTVAWAFAQSDIKQHRADHDLWINRGDYKSPKGEHCCGPNDCRPLDHDNVSATPAGWLIHSLGETIPYSEAQKSEDGDFWRCKRGDGSRRCFFAPPMGF